jgi:curved DNA-binding protein CbpA
MTDINLAYAVLSNVQKRQKYDLVQGTTPRSYDRRGPGSMSHSGRQSDGTGPSTERPFAFRPIS